MTPMAQRRHRPAATTAAQLCHIYRASSIDDIMMMPALVASTVTARRTWLGVQCTCINGYLTSYNHQSTCYSARLITWQAIMDIQSLSQSL